MIQVQYDALRKHQKRPGSRFFKELGINEMCLLVTGPDGMLSPFDLNHARAAGRHVPIGPVGPFGTLSPSDCHPAGPYVAGGGGALLAQMGRCLRLSLIMLARLAGMLLLALWVRLGCCPRLTVTLRFLTMLTRLILAPEWVRTRDPVIRRPPRYRWTTAPASWPWWDVQDCVPGSLRFCLVDPGGRTLLLGDGGPEVLEDDLVLGATVPLPAIKDSHVASLLGEMLVGNCDVTTNGNITAGLDGWSAPGMIGSSSGIVRAGCAAFPRCTGTSTCVDEYTEEDILDQFETLTACQCIMAVICMKIRIGIIRMLSQVRHMWKTI